MITIPMIVQDGALAPESDPLSIPDRIAVIMSGDVCTVYQKGDELPQPDPRRLLEGAKEGARSMLQQKRLEEEYAGPVLEIDGQHLRFPSTVKDETRLNSLTSVFAMAPEAVIPDWKIAPGVYVTMTAPLLMRAKEAGFAHIAATFSIERQKLAEIEACTTAEEVQTWLAEQLDAGWPE